jgi:hypothetical protein
MARIMSSKEELQLNYFHAEFCLGKLPFVVLCNHVNVDIIFNGKTTQTVKDTKRSTF